jgi:hypothetical protein
VERDRGRDDPARGAVERGVRGERGEGLERHLGVRPHVALGMERGVLGRRGEVGGRDDRGEERLDGSDVERRAGWQVEQHQPFCSVQWRTQSPSGISVPSATAAGSASE